MLTLLLFLLIFSVLVLVHEAGHFFVAKWCGMKVEEFGMGLPPRAWTIFTDKSGTKYTLNWIPFGGFVRLLGESDNPKSTADKEADPDYAKRLADPGNYALHPLWQRISVVVAGVVMNLVLAVVLLTGVFSVGFTPLAIVDDHALPFSSYLIQSDSFAKENGTLKINQDPTGIPVEKVEPGSVAEQAGLLVGDRIVAIGEARTLNGVDVSQALFDGRGKEVSLTVKRAGEEKTFQATLLPD